MTIVSLIVFCALFGFVRGKGKGRGKSAAIAAALAVPLYVLVMAGTQLAAS
jgi:hypothetical protein